VQPSIEVSSAAARAGNAAADAALTAKVKISFLADDTVKGLNIDVDTKDGVVTLNGSAGSSTESARAESLARAVDGVKSVQNRLTVGAGGPNTAVVTGPGPASAADSAGRAVDRAADATGRALDRAADATGRALDKAGDAIGDAAITAKVKSAFLADEAVKGLQIDVDTSNGVVTLTGTLDQRTHIERAESIAKRIDGVKSVQNRLRTQ
jgi:hyperosmotically inducible protein